MNRPDGSFQQQPPTRPPVPPGSPQGSVPSGGTGGRGRWIWALLIIGAFMINGMLTDEQDDTGDMVSAVSKDSKLQLQVPASWVDFKDTANPLADIAMVDPSGDATAFVASDTKEDLAEVSSLEEVAEAQLDRLAQQPGTMSDVSKGVSVSEYDPPAIRHVVRVTIDNVNNIIMITFLETESRIIQIYAGTVASKWKVHRDLLESISNSLQELSTS